jgi:SAM-dependent methyltransferase
MNDSKPWWSDYDDPFGVALVEIGDRNTSEEVTQLIQLLDLKTEATATLDAASGLGRHCLEFSRRGFSISGIEYQESFVKESKNLAKQAGLPCQFFQGDMRELPFADASFDHLICMWSSFGFFEEAGNLRTLSEFARVLKPGGKIFMSVWNPLQFFKRDYDWQKGDKGAIVLSSRKFDPIQFRLKSKYEIILGDQRSVKQIDIRLYTPPELSFMFIQVGFTPPEFHDGLSDQSFNSESFAMGVIAQKR